MVSAIRPNSRGVGLTLLAATAAWFVGTSGTAAANETIKVGYSSSYVFDEDAIRSLTGTRLRRNLRRRIRA